MMEAPPATTTTAEDCCVKVAVHIRPLIGDEKLQACQDCVAVVPGKPQVQLGTHSFTFDHVYGSSGSPSSAMFEDCVSPLVDGLFQGYNATVLAYGQAGSGKTYTMGTGFKDGYQARLIRQAMTALFNKIETLQDQIEFQLHVSFIEVLRERISWLEATNQDLCRELHEYRSKGVAVDQSSTKAVDSFCVNNEGIKRSLQSINSSDYQMSENGDSGVIEEETAKELEHTLLQDSMDKELHELNKRLEHKESEMRLNEGPDSMNTLKQHFGKKLMELEDEKRTVQKERDRLLTKVENLSATSVGQSQKMQDLHTHPLIY